MTDIYDIPLPNNSSNAYLMSACQRLRKFRVFVSGKRKESKCYINCLSAAKIL